MSLEAFPNLYRILGIKPPEELIPIAFVSQQPSDGPMAHLLLEMIARGNASDFLQIYQPVTDEEVKSLFDALDSKEKDQIDGRIWELDGKIEEWNYGATHRFDKKLTFFNAVLSSLNDKDTLMQSFKALPKETQQRIEMHLYILCRLQRYDSNENFGSEGLGVIEQLNEEISKSK
ncbi:MAG: hypothetical protein V4492_09745 [Chlamydiota bacterium]